MVKSNILAALIGAGILCGFLGVLIAWIKSAPIVIIMVVVMGMMLFDIVQTIREIRRNADS